MHYNELAGELAAAYGDSLDTAQDIIFRICTQHDWTPTGLSAEQCDTIRTHYPDQSAYLREFFNH